MATERLKSAGEIRDDLDALEEALEELRVSYDKYFAGIEKTAPVKQRDRLIRQFRLAERIHVPSTALRFRLSNLKARFVTYKHYWTRVEGELERGVSRRDLMRTRRLGPSPGAAADSDAARPEAEPAAAAEAPSAAPPSAPKRGPATSPAEVYDPAAYGLDPKHLRDVFTALVQAKKQAGESLQGLTYGAMCRKLMQEAPKLRERHRCEQVRFEVKTENGKVRLRARPL